jgi:hypothetical protein
MIRENTLLESLSGDAMSEKYAAPQNLVRETTEEEIRKLAGQALGLHRLSISATHMATNAELLVDLHGSQIHLRIEDWHGESEPDLVLKELLFWSNLLFQDLHFELLDLSCFWLWDERTIEKAQKMWRANQVCTWIDVEKISGSEYQQQYQNFLEEFGKIACATATLATPSIMK